MTSSIVVIIGAARSGTNILRDTICRLEGLATWPCDELPFLWRYGNELVPHDEFTTAHARNITHRRVRQFVERSHRALNANTLVEKTCANSLRVAFVERLLPQARFIFLVRDGIDAVASAIPRWSARFDLRYSLRKLRYVPARSMALLGAQFAINRAHALWTPNARIRVWGPRFDGITKLARSEPLHVVCAHQWARCIDKSTTQLSSIPETRVRTLKYERFVGDPVAHLQALADWLELTPRSGELSAAAASVSADSVGKGRRALTPQQRDAIEPIVASAMERHGYSLAEI